MKTKIIVTLIVLLAIGGILFLYTTRPVAAPSSEVTEEKPLDIPQNAKVWRISPQKSKAEFQIGEILSGRPFTVVGNTNNVSGQVYIFKDDPQKSYAEEIKINARTLKTDSEQRDGAIARVILKSEDDQYEFITFKPTEISGLPQSGEEGIDYSFKVEGDLKIKDTTRKVVFDVKAKAEGDQIIGEGHSTIMYKDFNLTIPEVPFVASVEDEVKLSLYFVLEKEI